MTYSKPEVLAQSAKSESFAMTCGSNYQSCRPCERSR